MAICFAQLSAHLLPGKELPSFSAGQIAAHILYLQEMLGYPQINIVFWTLCQEVRIPTDCGQDSDASRTAIR